MHLLQLVVLVVVFWQICTQLSALHFALLMSLVQEIAGMLATAFPAVGRLGDSANASIC